MEMNEKPSRVFSIPAFKEFIGCEHIGTTHTKSGKRVVVDRDSTQYICRVSNNYDPACPRKAVGMWGDPTQEELADAFATGQVASLFCLYNPVEITIDEEL